MTLFLTDPLEPDKNWLERIVVASSDHAIEFSAVDQNKNNNLVVVFLECWRCHRAQREDFDNMDFLTMDMRKELVTVNRINVEGSC